MDRLEPIHFRGYKKPPFQDSVKIASVRIRHYWKHNIAIAVRRFCARNAKRVGEEYDGGSCAPSFPQIARIRTGQATRNVLRIDLLDQFRGTYLVRLELVPRLLVGFPSFRQEFESLRVAKQLSKPR